MRPPWNKLRIKDHGSPAMTLMF